jgi:hypothetical protein
MLGKALKKRSMRFVQGMIHIPWIILENKNISTPTPTAVRKTHHPLAF